MTGVAVVYREARRRTSIVLALLACAATCNATNIKPYTSFDDQTMDFVGDAGYRIERAISTSWHVECGRFREGDTISDCGDCAMRPIESPPSAGGGKRDKYRGLVVKLGHSKDMEGPMLSVRFEREVPFGSRMRISTRDTILSRIAVPGTGGKVWTANSARAVIRQFIRGDTATWYLILPNGEEQSGVIDLRGFAAALDFCAQRLGVDPFAPAAWELKSQK